MKNRTVAFHTLGCKLNFSETSAIAKQLDVAGFTKTDFSNESDIYVINTCSVTENADKECRQIVRAALKKNPEAFVAVIGCYAQLKPEEISTIPGVDLVLGAGEKFNIVQYLNDLTKRGHTEIHSCEVEDVNTFISAYSIGERTRAFLKVQDGCDYSCTYCTIPLARGISRSDTLTNVVDNAKNIAAQGIKEIVLTGVNIGDYGKGEHGNKKHENTFFDLVKELEKIDGIERLRISSIEPNLLKNETIDLVSASKKFVPHFHIPLQSGSDTILKLMRRRYLTGLYKERITKIKQLIPDCCIGVDVIVGFPGETEKEFTETYNFLNSLDISYLHVFTYSERDNTDAINYPGIVPTHERQQRNKMLQGLSAKKKRAFYASQVGRIKAVLYEHENRNGMMYGFTENYVRVEVPYNPINANKIIPTQLMEFAPSGNITGQFVSELTPA